jgi:predicted RNA-binding Zn ribbon-like protein
MTRDSDLVGGDPALDFVNTRGGIRTGVSDETLTCYADLLDWSVRAGLLEELPRVRLLVLARKEERAAKRMLVRAKTVREAIHGVFHAVAHGRPAPKADLECLNEELADAWQNARIVQHEAQFAWGWTQTCHLDRPLWPITCAAGDLLARGPLERVRECASDTCGWLFLDASKNGSRRWCDMRDCGNRAKVRRYRTKLLDEPIDEVRHSDRPRIPE